MTEETKTPEELIERARAWPKQALSLGPSSEALILELASALATSQARQRELEEALRRLAAELDRAATDRQAWADHPGIGGNKPRFASHLRGKRYGYSHAAQLIRALLNSPAGEQPEGCS